MKQKKEGQAESGGTNFRGAVLLDKDSSPAEQKRVGQAGAGDISTSGRRIPGEPGGHDHEIPVGIRRRRNGAKGDKPMRWPSLHHHTTFSFGDGAYMPEVHLRRAAELNMQAIAFTEHGNVASHAKAQVAADKNDFGVKPIFGCEMYTGGVSEEDHTQRKNHLTLLAGDERGYANLIQLVTRSWEEGFYYEPTVSNEMLADNSAGIYVLSGCQGSLLATSLIGGKLIDPSDASYRRGLRVAQRFVSTFGERYFLEVQAFPELEKTRQLNPMIERIARVTGASLIADMDIHYTTPEEAEIQKVLHNCRPGEKKTLEEMEQAWSYEVPICPPISDKVIYRRLVQTGLSPAAARASILNAEELAQQINFRIPKLPMVEYPLPPGYNTPRELWRDWIKDGWKYRGFDKLPRAEREEHKARLKHEMDLIEDKGYEWYFLFVADAVQWAKENEVAVGPARGSAAASLVCFCLRITEVNPMVHKQLMFERFIDVSRADMPDIDLDFDAETRWKLREYYRGKLGEGMVFNLGTFVYYKSRNSLDDVARVHRIPKYKVETIKGQLIERSSGDLRASATIADTIKEFPESRAVAEEYPEIMQAAELEGNVKNFGVHAAGLIIGEAGKVVPILRRKIKEREVEVVAVDKFDAPDLGLLKMDFLGLKTMSVLWKCCQALGMSLEDLYALPLDDPKTIEGFQMNDVVGVFQLDGPTARLVASQILPDNFQEVCDVIALARPGPLHNGAAEAYIGIKNGTITPERWHPAVDRILERTHYQIVYQEQILRIIRDVGGFDWTATSEIRKIISRKEGDQKFNRKREEFMQGVSTLTERYPDLPIMTFNTGETIWNSCITAGAYTFNFAHTCSYGLISNWTMYFKRNHPAVFFAASLEVVDQDKDKRNALIRDAMRPKEGRPDIDILPPSVRRSRATWSPVKRNGTRGPAIRMGFQQLPKIGEKMATRILEERGDGPGHEHGWTGWSDLMRVKGVGDATMQGIQTFVHKDDPFDVFDADRRIEVALDVLPELDLSSPTHRTVDIPYARGTTAHAIWMGVARQKNLRDIFEINRARKGTELDASTVRDPHLHEFMLLMGDDGDELLRLRIDRFHYPVFKRALWGLTLDKDVVWVEGYKPRFRAAREIYVKRMVVIGMDD
jgi:Zierdtviridae DNA polymerase